MMDEEQHFAFDTWGFPPLEEAIMPEQVAELKATVDEKGTGPPFALIHESI